MQSPQNMDNQATANELAKLRRAHIVVASILLAAAGWYYQFEIRQPKLQACIKRGYQQASEELQTRLMGNLYTGGSSEFAVNVYEMTLETVRKKCRKDPKSY